MAETFSLAETELNFLPPRPLSLESKKKPALSLGAAFCDEFFFKIV